MATSGKEWRNRAKILQEQGVEVTLPSGNIARVRNVPMARLLVEVKSRNELDRLTPILAEQLGTSKSGGVLKPEQVVGTAGDYYAFVDMVVRMAMVEPRVVDDPVKDDEIAITDMEQEDKYALVELLEMPARELEPFRQRLARYVATLADEPDVPETTESGVERIPA